MNTKTLIMHLFNNKHVSLSLIKQKLNTSFINANQVFHELLDYGYVVKEGDNYVLNKPKIKQHFNLEKVQKMKAIFLDVDGVLNCRTTTDLCGVYRGIEDKKVFLLKMLQTISHAKIVLISTWKYEWYKDNKSAQDFLANYLDKKLAKQGLKIFDKAEDSYFGLRGEGVLEYIENLQNEGILVEKYVILDDEMFDYESSELIDHVVKTDFEENGLEAKHIEKAVKLLID